MAVRRPKRASTPVPFYLYRRRDVSGVSGTGVVAVGVVLPSGKAVLEWCSRWPTVTLFHSIDQILRIHGHGGETEVRYGPVPDSEDPPAGPSALFLPRQSDSTARGSGLQRFSSGQGDRPRTRRWWGFRPLELHAANWPRRVAFWPWRRRKG